jgi:predicted HAD superfamily Cof-like phosphohydrolase
MTPEEMLREFHEAAHQVGGGFGTARLRQELLDSEVQELRDAIAAGDRVLAADALADIVYVAVGTAVRLGIPFDKVLAEVHRSNMTKLIPPIELRADGKILKGPHYEPPQIEAILADFPVVPRGEIAAEVAADWHRLTGGAA